MKSILFVLSQAGSRVEASESLDAALVAAAFDQNVSLLFTGEGVRLLVAGGPLADNLDALADYGIRRVFICKPSLDELGMEREALAIEAQPMSFAAQRELISAQDAVVSG